MRVCALMSAQDTSWTPSASCCAWFGADLAVNLHLFGSYTDFECDRSYADWYAVSGLLLCDDARLLDATCPALTFALCLIRCVRSDRI